MKIGILGTGIVGNTIGTALINKGHQVKMGSRSNNNEKAAGWVAQNGANASQGTFADAAQFGELVFNCTQGEHSLDALTAAKENLTNKIVVDVSNSLDFSKGMPPTLFLVNDTSLGETIQARFPEAKVVKTLNTLTCSLMVNPDKLANGDHHIFICGNDASAKETIKKLLHDSFT